VAGHEAKSNLQLKTGQEISVEVPAPVDPVPFFELTVKAPEIAYIRFSGPRNGEFLAADEVRFVPLAAK